MTKPTTATELCDLTATEARRLIGTKEISPVELVKSCIQRVEAVDGAVNCMVTRAYDRAREEAKAAEQMVMEGDDLGLLHGLPVGIKDLEATEGVRTTWGSLINKDTVPEADQGSVAAVRAEGAIILGKTNTPEFGAGANQEPCVRCHGQSVQPGPDLCRVVRRLGRGIGHGHGADRIGQ